MSSVSDVPRASLSTAWKAQEDCFVKEIVLENSSGTLWMVGIVAKPRGKLTFSYPLERSAQRFRELIVYISQQSVRDPHFGATKLNKILYHSDFRAFERFGVPLTGVRYFRLPQGPAPRALLPVRQELEREGAIAVYRVDLGEGYTQHRTKALRAPVLEHFTRDELDVVDEVIRELWNQNAAEVSNASHDIRWRTLEHKDNLPYEFAFLSDDGVTESDLKRTRELATELGWERVASH